MNGRRSRSPRVAGFLAVAALSALAPLAFTAGCADRTYLTPSHGRAYSEAFSRQAVPPRADSKAKRATATQGLDPQEAAAVSRNYRRSIGGKEGGGDANPQPMVIMNPGAHAAPYLPPPSVPNSQ